MFCVKCGNKIENAKFCSNCGTPSKNDVTIKQENLVNIEVKQPIVNERLDLYNTHVGDEIENIAGIAEEVLWEGQSVKAVSKLAEGKKLRLRSLATSAAITAMGDKKIITTVKVTEYKYSLMSSDKKNIEFKEIVSVGLCKRGFVEKQYGVGDMKITTNTEIIIIENIKDYDEVEQILSKQLKLVRYNTDRYNQDLSGNITRLR